MVDRCIEAEDRLKCLALDDARLKHVDAVFRKLTFCAAIPRDRIAAVTRVNSTACGMLRRICRSWSLMSLMALAALS